MPTSSRPVVLQVVLYSSGLGAGFALIRARARCAPSTAPAARRRIAASAKAKAWRRAAAVASAEAGQGELSGGPIAPWPLVADRTIARNRRSYATEPTFRDRREKKNGIPAVRFREHWASGNPRAMGDGALWRTHGFPGKPRRFFFYFLFFIFSTPHRAPVGQGPSGPD